MKKKLLPSLVILVLIIAGLIGFSKVQKRKKSAVPSEPPVMASVSAPESGGDLKEVPTRPATAEEAKRCDTEALPPDTTWPVERSWRMGRNNALDRDICLASTILHLKNGKTKRIDDAIIDANEATANNTYSINAYLKDAGFFLVSNNFMEGESFLLYSDETGEDTAISCSEPVFSPSKTALFSFCTNSDDEASTNSIGVWSSIHGTLKEVYASGDLPWTPANLKWLDDNTIALDRQTGNPEAAGGPAKITRSGDTWVMDPPAPTHPLINSYDPTSPH